MSFKIDKFHPLNNVSIPKGSITNLRGIVKQIEPGFACGQHNSEGIGVIHLRPYNINSNGNLVFAEDKFVPADFSNKRTKINDVFFNNTNSPELVGKTSLIEGEFANQAFSNHMYRIELLGSAEPKFVAMQLHFLFLYGYFKHKCTSHVNQASISQNELLDNTAIFLPDIEKQRKIISLIDKKIVQIEYGLNSLEQAEKQLELYRQSVLKDAFEGKLTADWRAANPDLVEPADKLLDRIEAERKAAHQTELDAWADAVNQWEANGKDGKKPSKPKMVVIEHKQAIDFSSESSPYLMCYLSHLGDFGRGKSKHRPRNDPNLYGGDYPFIQTGDVGNSLKKITEYSKTYNEFGLAQSKLWPAGTLCITIAANIADTAFLSFDACFPDSVVGFTMDRNLLNPDYVYYFFEHVQERLESYAPATAQKNINLQILNEVLIPFCSLHEQKVIVEKLENNDQIINQNKRIIKDNLKKANALKQSILKQAFSGHELLEDAS